MTQLVRNIQRVIRALQTTALLVYHFEPLFSDLRVAEFPSCTVICSCAIEGVEESRSWETQTRSYTTCAVPEITTLLDVGFRTTMEMLHVSLIG